MSFFAAARADGALEHVRPDPASSPRSYADGYQPLWDSFMRKMESIAAFVPYMTTPGNHEVRTWWRG